MDTLINKINDYTERILSVNFFRYAYVTRHFSKYNSRKFENYKEYKKKSKILLEHINNRYFKHMNIDMQEISTETFRQYNCNIGIYLKQVAYIYLLFHRNTHYKKNEDIICNSFVEFAEFISIEDIYDDYLNLSYKIFDALVLLHEIASKTGYAIFNIDENVDIQIISDLIPFHADKYLQSYYSRNICPFEFLLLSDYTPENDIKIFIRREDFGYLFEKEADDRIYLYTDLTSMNKYLPLRPTYLKSLNTPTPSKEFIKSVVYEFRNQKKTGKRKNFLHSNETNIQISISRSISIDTTKENISKNNKIRNLSFAMFTTNLLNAFTQTTIEYEILFELNDNSLNVLKTNQVPTFEQSNFEARAVGIYLWDLIHICDFSKSKAFKTFREKFPDSSRHNSEDSVLFRDLSLATECIDNHCFK